MAAPRPPCPTEAQEGIAIVAACRRMGIDIVHVPNGGYRHVREAMSLQRQGVVAGMPDYLILRPLSDGTRCWIELKRRHGSTVSTAQKQLHSRLRRYGDTVIVAHGAKEAMTEISKLTFSVGPVEE